MSKAETKTQDVGRDFIRDIIRDDLESGHIQTVIARFPPEPNGYLHIGHAKSMCLNFGVASEFGGHCSLRFDDTNPTKEEHEFIANIQKDVRWMGFDWGEHLYFASDYFDILYEWAEHLIGEGESEGDGLARSGLRGDDEVAAMRFGLRHRLLDGSGRIVTAGAEGLGERGGGFGKRHGGRNFQAARTALRPGAETVSR